MVPGRLIDARANNVPLIFANCVLSIFLNGKWPSSQCEQFLDYFTHPRKSESTLGLLVTDSEFPGHPAGAIREPVEAVREPWRRLERVAAAARPAMVAVAAAARPAMVAVAAVRPAAEQVRPAAERRGPRVSAGTCDG
jgi:hypothetical protein